MQGFFKIFLPLFLEAVFHLIPLRFPHVTNTVSSAFGLVNLYFRRTIISINPPIFLHTGRQTTRLKTRFIQFCPINPTGHQHFPLFFAPFSFLLWLRQSRFIPQANNHFTGDFNPAFIRCIQHLGTRLHLFDQRVFPHCITPDCTCPVFCIFLITVSHLFPSAGQLYRGFILLVLEWILLLLLCFLPRRGCDEQVDWMRQLRSQPPSRPGKYGQVRHFWYPIF